MPIHSRKKVKFVPLARPSPSWMAKFGPKGKMDLREGMDGEKREWRKAAIFLHTFYLAKFPTHNVPGS